eukprot:Clim_evm27s241 gene=Clim_evmTU27s241
MLRGPSTALRSHSRSLYHCRIGVPPSHLYRPFTKGPPTTVAPLSLYQSISTRSRASFSASPPEAMTNIVAKSVASTPVARRDDAKKWTYHERDFPDAYHWLREKTSSEVIGYLEDENKYTVSEYLTPTAGLRAKLYDEFLGRIKEDDEEVPKRKGPYLYYRRTVKGMQYPKYCRKTVDEGSEEEVLLDLNELKNEYQVIGSYRISPDHTKVAYTLDTAGDEKFKLYVKDLKTGDTEYQGLDMLYFSLEWGNDSATLYYDVLNDALRPYRAYRHIVGADPKTDELLIEEENGRFNLGLGKTSSEDFIYVEIESSTAAELWLIDANDPKSQCQLFRGRRDSVLYALTHHRDLGFLVLTNESECHNFKLLQVSQSKPADLKTAIWTSETEKAVLEYDPSTHLLDCVAKQDTVVLYRRCQGLKSLRFLPIDRTGESATLNTGAAYDLALNEAVYNLSFVPSAHSYDDPTVRYLFSSPKTPDETWDYDLVSRGATLRKRAEIPDPNFDPANYATERIFVPVPKGDGDNLSGTNDNGEVLVPVSLSYRKDLFKQDGSSPLHLYGYGSYGISVEPSFSRQRISLLDRGIAFAMAHIRGGGDNGRTWYLDGKFLAKRNTFTDFVAVGKFLQEQNYTRPDRMTIEGRSAGGLLMGAVLNLAPEMSTGAILGVPFVDVINTMMDVSIPLTEQEYEEWGPCNTSLEYFDYMLSYSPYDNLRTDTTIYPALLIRAGLNDPRVQYWEPAKYTAMIRHHQAAMLKSQPDAPLRNVFLDTKMGSGHFGASGRYEYLKENAIDYAFIVGCLKPEEIEKYSSYTSSKM